MWLYEIYRVWLGLNTLRQILLCSLSMREWFSRRGQVFGRGANFLHSCATIRHEIASFSRSRRRARRMSALREIAVAEFVWSGPRRLPIPIAVTVPYWFFPISTEHCYPYELGRFPLLATRSPAQRGPRRSLAIAERPRDATCQLTSCKLWHSCTKKLHLKGKK